MRPLAMGSARRPRAGVRGGRLEACALAMAVTACGDDDGTGPSDDVDFPFLEAAVRAEFCIRGQIVPPDAEDESIQDTDCPTVFPVGFGPGLFYETWRVRVASRTTVTMFTESDLDTYLDVFEVDSSDPVVGIENLVTFDDDSGVDLNASLDATLQPDTEYWVMVSTLGELGSYTLRMTD